MSPKYAMTGFSSFERNSLINRWISSESVTPPPGELISRSTPLIASFFAASRKLRRTWETVPPMAPIIGEAPSVIAPSILMRRMRSLAPLVPETATTRYPASESSIAASAMLIVPPIAL